MHGLSRSEAAGASAAVIYTLLGTAKLNGVGPLRYLRHVLERVADHPINAVAPDRPVILWRIDGHTLVANSRALAPAGIDRNTQVPDGGAINKDASGEPDGMIRENATQLINKIIPPVSIADRTKSFRTAFAYETSHGWPVLMICGKALTMS